MSTQMTADKTSERGMSLLEVLVAISVLVIALMGTVLLIRKAEELSAISSETAIAAAAAQKMAEQIQNNTFSDIYAIYNVDTSDDPGGSGTAAGPHFSVSGLIVQSTDTDQKAGRIVFPEEVNGSTITLSETYDTEPHKTKLEMPRDLNGDADAADTDVGADYKFLPIIVMVEYTSEEGFDRSDYFYFLLSDRD